MATKNEVMHTAEPWAILESSQQVDKCFVGQFAGNAYVGDIAELHYQSSRPEEVQAANARRIVACVNALAGVPLDDLERVASRFPKNPGSRLSYLSAIVGLVAKEIGA